LGAQASRGALAPLEQLAGQLGYSVVYRTLAKGHGGSCDPQAKVLTVNDTRPSPRASTSSVMSLGTRSCALGRREEDPSLGYVQEELVAELVAHLAVSFVGLDSSASAVPYLASWAESAAPDTCEQIAALVDRLARRLEDALSDASTPQDPPLPRPTPAPQTAGIPCGLDFIARQPVGGYAVGVRLTGAQRPRYQSARWWRRSQVVSGAARLAWHGEQERSALARQPPNEPR
jgi:hypothetical protein